MEINADGCVVSPAPACSKGYYYGHSGGWAGLQAFMHILAGLWKLSGYLQFSILYYS